MRTKNTIIFSVLFLAIFVVTGCAANGKVADSTTNKGRALKKKIALLPISDPNGYGGEDSHNEAEVQLKAFLGSKCDDLLIMDSANIRSAFEQMPPLPSGQWDNLAVAALGRAHGFHAVLEQRIGHIKYLSEERGIWGFRNPHALARLSINIRAYDIETTAVLFDEDIDEAVEVSHDEWQRLKDTNQYDEETALRLFNKIVPRVGRIICKHLAEQAWRGYIKATADNTFAITAGKDIGLAPGHVLDVFGMGESVKGHSGQIYLLSGPKIGEIKVTEVQADRAKAIGIVGGNLEKSSCVKLTAS